MDANLHITQKMRRNANITAEGEIPYLVPILILTFLLLSIAAEYVPVVAHQEVLLASTVEQNVQQVVIMQSTQWASTTTSTILQYLDCMVRDRV